MWISPLGDRAWLARFEDELAAFNWADAARRAALPGVGEVVLAYRSAAIYARADADDLDDIEAAIRAIHTIPINPTAAASRLVKIPVLYDGPDLTLASDRLGLAEETVVQLHVTYEYRVYAIGFLPGFPYAGYLPPALSGLPRMATPRTRVAAGSVGLAGRQTGIYPQDSPGGWNLIGRTPLAIADMESSYFPLRAGDRIRFVAIGRVEFEARKGERL